MVVVGLKFLFLTISQFFKVIQGCGAESEFEVELRTRKDQRNLEPEPKRTVAPEIALESFGFQYLGTNYRGKTICLEIRYKILWIYKTFLQFLYGQLVTSSTILWKTSEPWSDNFSCWKLIRTTCLMPFPRYKSYRVCGWLFYHQTKNFLFYEKKKKELALIFLITVISQYQWILPKTNSNHFSLPTSFWHFPGIFRLSVK